MNDAAGSPRRARSEDDRNETLARLTDVLDQIRSEMLAFERSNRQRLERVLPVWRRSARNLLHYLALRRRDLRTHQEALVQVGLSSLGRCEGFVLSNLESVLRWLRPAGERKAADDPNEPPCDFDEGRRLLREATGRLFGERGTDEPLIMVTMPTEAARDEGPIPELVRAGMRVMRINCAHDDPATWSAMIDRLRSDVSPDARSCRVMMDIAGPKLRTGPLADGPRLLRLKPQRDPYGRTLAPARLFLGRVVDGQSLPDGTRVLDGDRPWCRGLRAGDEIRLRDTSGRRRRLTVAAVEQQGVLIESDRGVRIAPETRVRVVRRSGDRRRRIAEGGFGPIPPLEQRLTIAKGDLLRITPAEEPGRGELRSSDGSVRRLAQIGCTLPEIFADVNVGDRILIDDGKIGGIVTEADERALTVRITRTGARGGRLKGDKGMNFPDTRLRLPALTAKDIRDLSFVVDHADLVAYSFVRDPQDVLRLSAELHGLEHEDFGVVLKIETRQAFENLPLILLEAMACHPAFGVMIARGDLAVECGWERLVEIQEEVLWMAEAAHVPVIWATQVLEGLAQEGLPSRAELSDAGLAARAECVMLNKGPNVVEAVRVLHDILRRMQQHQVKKRPTFRPLKVADGLQRSSDP